MTGKQLWSKPAKRQTLSGQLADDIRALIISGDLESGANLPSEAEIADQYGVSRSVVRDATRILMTQGLVEVVHGAGVFVTEVQNDAFAEALLLSLQRSNASVWDVEQFELLLFPEILALAAAEASEAELESIRARSADYLQVYNALADDWDTPTAAPGREQARIQETLQAAYQEFIVSVFLATHNKLIAALARPLVNLRNVRNWEPEDGKVFNARKSESRYFEIIIQALESRNPEKARTMIRDLMQLPPQAIESMKETPVSEIATIRHSSA